MRYTSIGAVLALGFAAAPALADFPERDLRGIIMWGAGGSTDTVMRSVTPHAEEALGEDIIMSNMTGGVGAGAQRGCKGGTWPPQLFEC